MNTTSARLRSPSFDAAATKLARINEMAQAGNLEVAEISSIIEARDGVLSHYQEVFRSDRLDSLTEVEFREFLHFKNNRHWAALQRLGPFICQDMDRLREGLGILLDEGRPIEERLTRLVPGGNRPAYVYCLGKAYLTAILLIVYPNKYGVWNRIAEDAMKDLGVWPEFDRGEPFGSRYLKVNEVLLAMADAVGVDLWTLDALWWRAIQSGDAPRTALESQGDPVTQPFEQVRFGLERHLHEFLRDNWESTDLGREWGLYEEDGDPEAGYEYRAGEVGYIDLLAKHRRDRRWLVIELKRGQTSDETAGQVLRYMGWVRKNLAGEGEAVEGLIIAHEADGKLDYAVSEMSNVGVQIYSVEFKLNSHALE